MFTKIKNFLNKNFKKSEPSIVIPVVPEVPIWRFKLFDIPLHSQLQLAMHYSIFVTVDGVPVAKYSEVVRTDSDFRRTCNLINYGDSDTMLNFNKPLNIQVLPGKVDIDIVRDGQFIIGFNDVEIDHGFK